jgi:hypothetical protein
LRSFIKIHFKEKKSLVYERETKLRDRLTFTEDSDVSLHIVHKTEMDDMVILSVQDESDGCELHAFKYFNFLEVNDVIRLRSFKVYDKNVIIMNKNSNILKVPEYTDYYRDFMNRISMKMKAIEPTADVPMYDTIQGAKDNAVQCVAPEEIPNRKINNISENKFIIDVNILSIQPQETSECILSYCEKCHMR